MGETVCHAVEGADDMALVGRADPRARGRDRRRPRRRRRGRGLHDARGGARTTRARASRRASTASRGPPAPTSRELEGVGHANLFVAPNFAIGAVLMMQVGPGDREAPAGVRDHRAASRPQARRALGHGAAHGRAPARRRRERARADPLGPAARAGRAPGGDLRRPGQTLSVRHDSTDRESFMPGVLLAIRKVGSLEQPPDRRAREPALA